MKKDEYNEKIMVLSDGDFHTAVERGTVIVDFWAPWCGPCRNQTLIIHEMADGGLPDGVSIGKVNVDENAMLAQEFRIRTIPTLIVFKDGEVAARMSGVHTADRIMEAAGMPRT